MLRAPVFGAVPFPRGCGYGHAAVARLASFANYLHGHLGAGARVGHVDVSVPAVVAALRRAATSAGRNMARV